MREFAAWLAGTDASIWVASNLWVIPFVQSIHIVAIAVIFVSLFAVMLRIWGWAGRDMKLSEAVDRYGPWVWGSFVVLALTGLVMIVGEPARELVSFSFWAKMVLILVGLVVFAAFQSHLRRHRAEWDATLVAQPSTKAFAAVMLVVWIGVIAMGRFIAWDGRIWGPLSPQAAV